MEKKELIKLYLQNVDKMFGYANMNAYIDERLKKYTKYCQSKKPEEQIIIWLKLLHENFGKKIVYLGSYLALQEKDMSYLCVQFGSNMGTTHNNKQRLRPFHSRLEYFTTYILCKPLS